MSGMVWEEPVREALGTTFLKEAEILRANPGKWARLRTLSTNGAAAQLAKRIRRREPVAFREGEWEARANKISNTEYRVYVRYIGE